jgi:hypothetical protein
MTTTERDAAQAFICSLCDTFRTWAREHPGSTVGVILSGLTIGLADIMTPMVRHGALPGCATAAIDEVLQLVRSELVSREL